MLHSARMHADGAEKLLSQHSAAHSTGTAAAALNMPKGGPASAEALQPRSTLM
jgi:hypothetical protein